MNRLPPLDALHTFSVVARERSMSRAAEALFVTQSAVSRQIRQLEDHLGVSLFIRQARGIELTAAGRQLLPSVAQAFEGLQRAVAALNSRPTDLKLRLPPTLALRWFLPRLGDFQRRHPDIEVRMSTASFYRIRFEHEDFDAGIFTGKEVPSDVYSVELYEELLTPVCSPALAARLHTPADLAREALIHLTADHADWRQWLIMAGVSHPALEAGPSFELIDMAVNVAGQGLGVALADPILIADDLHCGRLVAPFPTLALSTNFRYWFACPRSRRSEPPLAALCAWLVSEIGISLAAWRPQAGNGD